MSIHASPDQFDQPSLPFGASFGERGSSYQSRKMIRSVVEGAGIGSFVYLKGHSGRRYVFSAIESDHASLYSSALFADVTNDGAIAALGANAPKDEATHQLYVHVMDGDAIAHMETMADLAVSVTRA